MPSENSSFDFWRANWLGRPIIETLQFLDISCTCSQKSAKLACENGMTFQRLKL